MIIERHTIGAGRKSKNVYGICTTPAENGSDRPLEIARFQTLEQAALVLRYMAGGDLNQDEAEFARVAMRQAEGTEE